MLMSDAGNGITTALAVAAYTQQVSMSDDKSGLTVCVNPGQFFI